MRNKVCEVKREGYAARVAGKGTEANPYDVVDDAHFAWLDGYEAAAAAGYAGSKEEEDEVR